jgi:hypothetical protein
MLPPLRLPGTERPVLDEAGAAEAQRVEEEARAVNVQAILKEFVAAFRFFKERAKVQWSQIN